MLRQIGYSRVAKRYSAVPCARAVAVRAAASITAAPRPRRRVRRASSRLEGRPRRSPDSCASRCAMTMPCSHRPADARRPGRSSARPPPARGVEVGHLIEHFGVVGQRLEAVRNAGGNEHRIAVVLVEDDRTVLEIGRLLRPQVEQHVVDRSRARSARAYPPGTAATGNACRARVPRRGLQEMLACTNSAGRPCARNSRAHNVRAKKPRSSLVALHAAPEPRPEGPGSRTACQRQ